MAMSEQEMLDVLGKFVASDEAKRPTLQMPLLAELRRLRAIETAVASWAAYQEREGNCDLLSREDEQLYSAWKAGQK